MQNIPILLSKHQSNIQSFIQDLKPKSIIKSIEHDLSSVDNYKSNKSSKMEKKGEKKHEKGKTQSKNNPQNQASVKKGEQKKQPDNGTQNKKLKKIEKRKEGSKQTQVEKSNSKLNQPSKKNEVQIQAKIGPQNNPKIADNGTSNNNEEQQPDILYYLPTVLAILSLSGFSGDLLYLYVYQQKEQIIDNINEKNLEELKKKLKEQRIELTKRSVEINEQDEKLKKIQEEINKLEEIQELDEESKKKLEEMKKLNEESKKKLEEIEKKLEEKKESSQEFKQKQKKITQFYEELDRKLEEIKQQDKESKQKLIEIKKLIDGIQNKLQLIKVTKMDFQLNLIFPSSKYFTRLKPAIKQNQNNQQQNEIQKDEISSPKPDIIQQKEIFDELSSDEQKVESKVDGQPSSPSRIEHPNSESQINPDINPQTPPIIKTVKKFPTLPEQLKNLLNQVTQHNRGVSEEYKYYVRQRVSKQDLMQNYSIRNMDLKRKLGQHCDAMIPVRGDGNCFYTAFGYQLLKLVINDQQFYEDLKKRYQEIDFVINKDDQQLINKDIGRGLLIHFFKILEYFLSIEDQNERNDKFFHHFAAYQQEQEYDGFFNALTVIFLRNLSYKLVMESDQFREIVIDKENLLLWEMECNNNEPVILLLAENLKIHIKLIFFDNSDYNLNQYGKEHQKTIILLIRPGHYNIGEKVQNEVN